MLKRRRLNPLVCVCFRSASVLSVAQPHRPKHTHSPLPHPPLATLPLMITTTMMIVDVGDDSFFPGREHQQPTRERDSERSVCLGVLCRGLREDDAAESDLSSTIKTQLPFALTPALPSLDKKAQPPQQQHTAAAARARAPPQTDRPAFCFQLLFCCTFFLVLFFSNPHHTRGMAGPPHPY